MLWGTPQPCQKNTRKLKLVWIFLIAWCVANARIDFYPQNHVQQLGRFQYYILWDLLVMLHTYFSSSFHIASLMDNVQLLILSMSRRLYTYIYIYIYTERNIERQHWTRDITSIVSAQTKWNGVEGWVHGCSCHIILLDTHWHCPSNSLSWIPPGDPLQGLLPHWSHLTAFLSQLASHHSGHPLSLVNNN